MVITLSSQNRDGTASDRRMARAKVFPEPSSRTTFEAALKPTPNEYFPFYKKGKPYARPTPLQTNRS
jgi:hypothetical protein